ncbi:CsbD family protein [Streptomyces sp. NPDC005409]|uniref:CsbD family protein n=1 Tax=Streptomyces sp. NPDC005409 TaxID=3155342 RepID=UPI00345367E8
MEMSKAHAEQVKAETAGRTTGDERMVSGRPHGPGAGQTRYAKEDVKDVLRR